MKCILNGVSTDEKLTTDQTNAILDILGRLICSNDEIDDDVFVVLDVKLEMIVVRIENGIPHVQLNYNGRNLNNVIRALLPEPTSTTVIRMTSW